MSGTDRDDQELQELLSEAGKLRERYRQAAQEQPPAALDDAIRAAARRSVHAKPVAVAAPFGGSWRVPLSIAAVVVVSVTLTLTISERGQHLPVPPNEVPKAGAELQQPEVDRRRAPGLSVPPSRPASKDVTAPRSTTAPRDYDAKVSPGKAGNLPGIAAPGEGARPQEPAAPPPAPALGGTSAGNVAEAVDAQAREETRAAGDAERQTKLQARASAEPKQESSPRVAPAATADAAKEAGRPRAKAEAPGMAAGGDEVPPADELAKGRAKSDQAFPSAAANAARAPAAPPWESSPEAWLKHVDELRAQGLLPEARASFEGFRRRYPEYELPKGFVAP